MPVHASQPNVDSITFLQMLETWLAQVNQLSNIRPRYFCSTLFTKPFYQPQHQAYTLSICNS